MSNMLTLQDTETGEDTLVLSWPTGFEKSVYGDEAFVKLAMYYPEDAAILSLEEADALAKELTRRVTDERVARAQKARGMTMEDL